jgi:glycine/D-amino acid oxidase-like deaminating enzyme
VCYDHFGLDYLTQNLKSGELFYGGGLVKGKYHGLAAFGNPNDSGAAEDELTISHLKNSLPKWFGQENWGSDDVDKRVKKSWTGVMGFTDDLLPLVGRVPGGMGADGESKDKGEDAVEEEGEEWIAAGFNGYGMVNCWGSGKALVSMILNQSLPEDFPQSYIITKERLAKMKAENVVEGLLGAETSGND